MKIHTRTVWQMTDEGFELLSDEYYEYEGPLAEAGGKGKSSKPSPEQQKLTKLSIARIEREERELKEAEERKQYLLSAGRYGRGSLLTKGYTGPGTEVSTARAVTRAAEREDQKAKAASNRSWRSGGKGGSPYEAAAYVATKGKIGGPSPSPFSKEQQAYLNKMYGQDNSQDWTSG